MPYDLFISYSRRDNAGRAGDGAHRADCCGLSRATIFCVALLAGTDTPPPAAGAERIPAGLVSLAADCEERFARVVHFAGRSWGVKEAPSPVGPGGNRFSSAAGDVFVDRDGLHPTLTHRDGHRWSSEVVLLDRLGFGTYTFETRSRVDTLDANAVFGGFLWDPYGDEETAPGNPHREIDFEDGRRGDPDDPRNSQFVVVPHAVPGNRLRYALPDLSGDALLTRSLTWSGKRIAFAAPWPSSSTPPIRAPTTSCPRRAAPPFASTSGSLRRRPPTARGPRS